MTLVLDGRGLTPADVVSVAREGRRVALSADAAARMLAARAAADAALDRGERVYGLTTGLGALRPLRLDRERAAHYASMTIAGHRTAHGPPLPEEAVRAAMVVRANGLARGGAAVRPEVAEAYVSALNDGVAPTVHAIGSVGMSDLPAMAEIAAALVERGLELLPGEALATLNSNALSVGLASLGAVDAARLLDALDAAGALSLEGFAGNLSPLHPAAARARPYPGLERTAARLRELLAGSPLEAPGAPRLLQDPLSFRCISQVHGAARDTLAHAEAQLVTELNAAADNPLHVAEEGRLISTGNFDITPVAIAVDALRIALAAAITLSGERVQKLIAGATSGLPTGLRAEPDLPEDALTLVGGGAAALAAEARLLGAPVTLELPTSWIAGGIEDHVTMAPLGARRLREQVALGARLAAVELHVAAQAVDVRRPAGLGRGTAAVHAEVRRRAAFVGPGQAPDLLLEELERWAAAGAPLPAQAASNSSR